MKKYTRIPGRGWSRALMVAAAALALGAGCSVLTDPGAGEPAGTITLAFDFAQQGGRAVAGSAEDAASHSAIAPAAIDSVVVAVFRPGGGFEARRGETVPGPGSVAVTLSCIAEDNKRVSVELFDQGVMTYHGVNEDVDVKKDETTDVLVDAYEFVVSALTIAPAVITDGESFAMSWDSAPAATSYRVQASTSPFFETVDWENTLTDTFTTLARSPGLHYFRVAPRTAYALGTFAPVEGGYVLGGGNATTVTGFDVPEVAPGDNFSVYGENLDFPGTRVFVGATPCQVVSRAWDELVVTVNRAARSGYVFVESPLDGGATYWDAPLSVQRIAYVSTGEQYFDHYKRYIEDNYPEHIEYSTVKSVPAADLDWRDMSVFDVIIVANDMGMTGADWGDRNPGRASAIAESGTNVLAVGLGGAIYLALATGVTQDLPIAWSVRQWVYVPNELSPVFTSPRPVLSPGVNDMEFSKTLESMIALSVPAGQAPFGMNLLAEFFKGSDQWMLLDLITSDGGLNTVGHFFWGYAGDPQALTDPGRECLTNVVAELYRSAVSVPGPTALR